MFLSSALGGWIRLLPALMLAGCVLVVAPEGPIRAVHFGQATGPAAGRTLLVMLPGRGMAPGEFENQGLVPALRRSGLAVDAVAVDAHLGHYLHRTLPGRLLRDIVLPARERGYDEIWLLGISMGGVGALLFAQLHPDLIDGVILLAPYLGDEDLIEQIEQAGGPQKWQPTQGELTDERWQERLWVWLAEQKQPVSGAPPITLGVGRADRFARAARLLGRLLPAERFIEVDGGHDWPPWLALFQEVLSRGVLGCKR